MNPRRFLLEKNSFIKNIFSDKTNLSPWNKFVIPNFSRNYIKMYLKKFREKYGIRENNQLMVQLPEMDRIEERLYIISNQIKAL